MNKYGSVDVSENSVQFRIPAATVIFSYVHQPLTTSWILQDELEYILNLFYIIKIF